jgi:hypothetical protein
MPSRRRALRPRSLGLRALRRASSNGVDGTDGAARNNLGTRCTHGDGSRWSTDVQDQTGDFCRKHHKEIISYPRSASTRRRFSTVAVLYASPATHRTPVDRPVN